MISKDDAIGYWVFATWFSVVCAIVFIVLVTSGCTSFTAEALRADGSVAGRVSERGAPFTSRESVWEIEYEWLDEKTNTLNRLSVKRNTAENAEAQAKALDLLTKMAARGAMGL